jgi:RNA polymerase nonessential primary-like sigma factor
VAKLVDKPVETVSKMLELNDRICSLDVSVGESDKSLKDTIPDYQTNSPERLVSDDNLSGKLVLWINELPEKQKEVLIRRFGLMDHQQETLDQVGREVGLTRERVRQIQIDGLKRLRSMLKQNGLSRELMFSDIDEDYL